LQQRKENVLVQYEECKKADLVTVVRSDKNIEETWQIQQAKIL
jgi:hypothetical protein